MQHCYSFYDLDDIDAQRYLMKHPDNILISDDHEGKVYCYTLGQLRSSLVPANMVCPCTYQDASRGRDGTWIPAPSTWYSKILLTEPILVEPAALRAALRTPSSCRLIHLRRRRRIDRLANAGVVNIRRGSGGYCEPHGLWLYDIVRRTVSPPASRKRPRHSSNTPALRKRFHHSATSWLCRNS